jgi:hypothetical protein
LKQEFHQMNFLNIPLLSGLDSDSVKTSHILQKNLPLYIVPGSNNQTFTYQSINGPKIETTVQPLPRLPSTRGRIWSINTGLHVTLVSASLYPYGWGFWVAGIVQEAFPNNISVLGGMTNYRSMRISPDLAGLVWAIRSYMGIDFDTGI